MEFVYLIKIGEIALKGKNRNLFEKRLKDNLRNKLKEIPIQLVGGWGRYYISLTKDFDNIEYHEAIDKAIRTTFGITGYAKTMKVAKDINIILETIYHLIDAQGGRVTTFKGDAKRNDKQFPMTSMEINCLIGEKILERYKGSEVDVHNPHLKITVEIRDAAYIYLDPVKASGGLPVGIAGRGTLMLSGGIDSPVAGWMMAKRGLKLDAVYFHAYPYTSDQAKEKVIELARKLAPWNDGIALFIVPFTDLQMEINKNGRDEESTILMRCLMMEITHKITETRNNKAIITGEALSQVASQTAENLRVTSSHTDYPILRPLIGMDKEEIIEIAEKIDTFKTSILPYEDCCSLFSPKHPLIKADFDQMKKSYAKLESKDLIEQAIKNAEYIYLKK